MMGFGKVVNAFPKSAVRVQPAHQPAHQPAGTVTFVCNCSYEPLPHFHIFLTWQFQTSLFPNMKKYIRGRSFHDDDDVITAVE